jgi:MarR family 2-MHQ and catechol resistance regulon transcriptional repressor
MAATKRKSPDADYLERYYREEVRAHGRKYPGFHWPSLEVMFNLIYSYDVALNQIAGALAPHRLSPSAFNVLMILKRSGGAGRPLTGLSELLVVSRASVTGLVDCLEERGLVERTSDPADRRVRVAKITPKGAALIEELLPDYYPGIRAMCSALNAKEKSELCELLTKLRRGIRRASDTDEASHHA